MQHVAAPTLEKTRASALCTRTFCCKNTGQKLVALSCTHLNLKVLGNAKCWQYTFKADFFRIINVMTANFCIVFHVVMVDLKVSTFFPAKNDLPWEEKLISQIVSNPLKLSLRKCIGTANQAKFVSYLLSPCLSCKSSSEPFLSRFKWGAL